MRDRDQSILNEILPPEERAIEAVVARYQRVAPAVTRFARTLAGDDQLQVRLGTQATSAEGTIVLDPGVFQTAYARSAPVTPAEVALTSALHEVIHLIATDFDEERAIPKEWSAFGPSQEDEHDDHEGAMVPAGLFEFGEMEEDLVRREITEDDIDFDGDEGDEPDAVPLLVALNAIGGPAAEALFLSIEDARQERIHFEAYPGAGSVLRDLYRTSVGHAMGNARPLGQFALACFLIAGGHEERNDVQRRLAPHVAVALDDAMAFMEPVNEIDDPWAVGTIALQLLSVAKMHNLVQEGAGSTTQGRSAEMEADSASISQSVDAVRIVTPPLANREAYEQTRAAAQSVSARDGKKGDAEIAGDPATDQIMKVSTAPTVYLPTGQGGKLLVTDFPYSFASFSTQGREMLKKASLDWGVAQHRVSGELYPLFLANQRRGLRSGFDAGDLSPYTPLLLGAGLYERMFERRDLPSRRSYAVSLLVDGSASMLQPRAAGSRKSPWAMAAALLGAWTLAQLADELQIDFEIAIFNRSFATSPDDTEFSYREMRTKATAGLRQSQGGNAERLTRTVNHYLVKGFNDRWRASVDVLAGLFYTAAAPQDAARQARQDPKLAPPVSMFDRAANVDEFNLAYAAERLAAQRATHRIMVVLADGMTRGSVEALAETAASIEHGGATVLGIGIGDDTVRAAYSRAQVVEQPLDLASAMVDGVRSTLYRSIAASGNDVWRPHAGSRVLETFVN
ncbi:MAG: hypothetical protein BMS9Abin20_0752 [Acidimicrobiia bacterium]|nr:MAG: hypothetical protein BMS9Abin20_0752 [Acidimicrobiia bacterium]